MGRPRKSGKRTPAGELSREGRAAAEACAPGHLRTIRDQLLREVRDPLWRSNLGIMNLHGEITVQQLEAGKRWRNLAREYQSILGVRGIKSASVERIGASGGCSITDVNATEVDERDWRICRDFEAALDALHGAGRAAVFTVRLLCEEDQSLSWEQKRYAVGGLEALAVHWGLAKAA